MEKILLIFCIVDSSFNNHGNFKGFLINCVRAFFQIYRLPINFANAILTTHESVTYLLSLTVCLTALATPLLVSIRKAEVGNG